MKRFWGYLKNEKVQTWPHTLDVLAWFVGYKGYEDFCAQAERLDAKLQKIERRTF